MVVGLRFGLDAAALPRRREGPASAAAGFLRVLAVALGAAANFGGLITVIFDTRRIGMEECVKSFACKDRSRKGRTMLASTLIATSAGIVLLFGSIHLFYTLHGNKLHPRDAAVMAAMQQTHPVITRQTTIWRANYGFNVTHSMGLMLFGLIYGYLALAQSALLWQSALPAVAGRGDAAHLRRGGEALFLQDSIRWHGRRTLPLRCRFDHKTSSAAEPNRSTARTTTSSGRNCVARSPTSTLVATIASCRSLPHNIATSCTASTHWLASATASRQPPSGTRDCKGCCPICV